MSVFPVFIGIVILCRVYSKTLYNEKTSIYYSTEFDAIGDGSCNATHFQCQSNANNKITSFQADSPFDCCKACLNNSECVSWTHWYVNATYDYTISSQAMCNLFKTYNMDGLSAGNCVTGIEYDDNKYGTRPNIVFYYPDTIRKSSLSSYGFPLKTTPNLDNFVNNNGAIKFNSHVAQHSQCTPSRTVMITGMPKYII